MKRRSASDENVSLNRSDRGYRRILMIKPSSFGDVIHALPVLNGLRRRYPQARISWMLAHSCAGLLAHHPALDEVIPFDRKYYGKLGRNLRASVAFVQFVHTLWEHRFDLVLDLQGLFRSGFLTLTTGASTRIGFADARELSPIFYTRRIRTPHPQMHAVDRNYLVAEPLGFADVPITFDLPVNPRARASVQAMLSTKGIPPGTAYVLLGPGTRWETKQWPTEYLASVVNELRSRYRLPVVLTGMLEETPIAEKLLALADHDVVNLAGKTSLAEMIALVADASLVIMHDSGPMHLATALNKPMVAIYGPTSPQLTGPYHRPEAIARHDVPCSPCRIKKVCDCPYDHRCMRDLKPEVVSAQVAQTVATIAGIP